MAGHAVPNLPQITRFLAGMVTNRNPIDTPFQIIGLNVVQHHDALNDGLNMEISAYNTLVRRPGFSALPFWFPSGTVPAAPRDFFNYTNLNGDIHVYMDLAGSLYIDHNLIVSSDTPAAHIWSVVGVGDFVYAANGNQAIRMHSPFLNVPHQIGITPLQTPPQVVVSTASIPLFLSDFIPTNDQIAGTLVVSDLDTNRTLTITITTGNVHFNVTLIGLPITTVTSFTQIDTQTVSGPSTTDIISQTNGLTGTATGTGISNGVLAYYPTQGMSTLDFDVAVAGSLTLPLLVGIINNVQNLNFTQGGFTPAALSPLAVFVKATAIPGAVASTYYPDTAAVAMELIGNGA